MKKQLTFQENSSSYNKKMTTRWQIAQKSEKDFWNNYDCYSPKFIKEMRDRTNLFLFETGLKITESTRILEIGCGPYSIINCLNNGQRNSIDPLANFYKKKFKFDYKRTHLIEGTGENLPYKDGEFDVVICVNVLDHTDNPKKVLDEINRVLKKPGILYFENYYYSFIFLMVAKVYGFFKKLFTRKIFNVCHPHMFLIRDIENLLLDKFYILSARADEFKITDKINYIAVCVR